MMPLITDADRTQLVDILVMGIRDLEKDGNSSDVRTRSYLGNSIELPFDWTCREFLDQPSFCYQMNGFTAFDSLFLDWLDGKIESDKTLLLSYLFDWVETNVIISLNETNKWIYNDDAVARRVYRMSLYYYLWRDSIPRKMRDKIKKSLARQAKLLAQDSFYMKNHNHGMFQDLGLIAYSLLVGNICERRKYLYLAIGRSSQYFQTSFSSEGVLKEHSPDYHRWVLSLGARLYCEIFGRLDPEFSKSMEKLYMRGARYYTQLIMPDGTIPSIGDSARRQAQKDLFEDEQYQWVVSKGKRGAQPPPACVFPASGYAVSRSRWNNPNATYLLFLAASHSAAHKHSDDLSFILYHKGDLFVEAGNMNYAYHKADTAYSYSGFAHNVLLVNGNDFPVKIAVNGWQCILPEALKTRISSEEVSENKFLVTGIQERFAQATQERSILHDSAAQVVQVRDCLNVHDACTVSFIYHIAQGVLVERLDNGDILCTRDDEKVAEIRFKSDVKTNIQIITESQMASNLRVEIYEGIETPQMGSLIVVEKNVKCGIDETVLDIKLL